METYAQEIEKVNESYSDLICGILKANKLDSFIIQNGTRIHIIVTEYESYEPHDVVIKQVCVNPCLMFIDEDNHHWTVHNVVNGWDFDYLYSLIMESLK